MGDVVLPLVLESYGKLPKLNPLPAALLVTIFDESTAAASIELCNHLRAKHIPVAMYPEVDKLSKQFKYADRYAFKGSRQA